MKRESEYTRADIFNMCDHRIVRSIFHSDTNFDSFYCPDCGGIFEEHPSKEEEEEEE